LLSKKFLFYPLILFFLILILDKIFLLPLFHNEFLQAGNSVFYHQRKVLAERLASDADLKDKKLAVVFGDSRSYPFSEKGIPEKYQKNWSLYNFSGPQGVPMYSYFMLKDFLEKGIKPDFIILSLSPEAFDDTKGFINSPFMRMACNDACVEDVWNHLTFKDKYEFVLDRVFSLRSVEFNLNLFISRLKARKLKEYSARYNSEFQLINYSKGEYLMYATTANPIEKLEKDTRRVSMLYMRSYTLGESQIFYLKSFLKLANENKVPTLVLWPKVYPGYYASYTKFDIKNLWWRQVELIAKDAGAFAIDMNEASTCDLFNDASHQSVFCFIDQMKMIWQDYAEKK
jgi:hypothetical protein